jgi:hypothetical protein
VSGIDHGNVDLYRVETVGLTFEMIAVEIARPNANIATLSDVRNSLQTVENRQPDHSCSRWKRERPRQLRFTATGSSSSVVVPTYSPLKMDDNVD